MRELRLVLLAIALLIVLALGTTFLRRAFKTAMPPGTATVSAPERAAPESPANGLAESQPPHAPAVPGRVEVEAAIAKSADYTRVFDRIRQVFPSDYEAIITRLATANPASTTDLDKVTLETMDALRRAHAALMATASDDVLGRYFGLETQQIQALGDRDPHLCVVAASGGRPPTFLTFAADHRALVADDALAALDAMESGRTDQVQRKPVSDDDFQALDHALIEAGLSRPEISVVLDDAQPNPPISDERVCKAQQIYMTTVAGMPPDMRSRLLGAWAALVAKS